MKVECGNQVINLEAGNLRHKKETKFSYQKAGIPSATIFSTNSFNGLLLKI